MNSDNNYQMFGPTIEEHGKLNRGWKQKSIKYDIHDNYPIINRLYKNLIKYPASRYKGEITSVECLSGCFFGIKKEVIDRVGCFDEGTFLFYEEDIYCAKIRQAGLHICVLNNVQVIHNHSITINKNVNHYRKLRYLKASQLYYHQTCFNHSKHLLNRLKRSAEMACQFAYLRTNKK